MLDTKDFSWKGLTKEDKITFIATFVCPIVTLLGTVASYFIRAVKQFFGLSIDGCISWLYFLQAAFVAI